MAGRQPHIIWLNVLLIALTLTALCARVGRRVFVVRTFSGHDALITMAAISASVFSIFQIVSASFGLGLHHDEVDVTDLRKLNKLLLASNVFYFLCNWFVKHALLLFYSEIVRDKKYQVSIWIMHFVAFGFGASSVLVDIFQCRPFHKAWDSAIPGYCVNIHIFLYVNAAIMLTTDLVLYLMPVVFTWNLQLRRPQRIGLTFLFGLGAIVLAVSGARVKSVHMLAVGNDFTWWFGEAMIWSALENHLAIVVACAPSIKVIALLIFPRLASSLGKIVSKVTPSNSRSRSRPRASGPISYGISDLESGTNKSDGKLKPSPLSSPIPYPTSPMGSGGSRASRNFAKWFRGTASPIDGMEGRLVNAESTQNVHLKDLTKETAPGIQDRGIVLSPNDDNDIRVQHTITVEEGSNRGSSENGLNAVEIVSRAV